VVTGGAICNPYNAGEANDIDYVNEGVRTYPGVTTLRKVICAIPRVPGGGPLPSFFLAGKNLGGATTSATLFTYEPDGTLKEARTVSSSSANYILPVNSLAASNNSYSTVLVMLPPQGLGVFRQAVVTQ
jgi:hypothetical protein